MTSTNDKTYIAGGTPYLYPGVGDEKPPGGKKVLLLTVGGICIDGFWSDDPKRGFIAWAPLPPRDKAKEARLGLR